MSFSKILALVTVVLFGLISIASWNKQRQDESEISSHDSRTQEIQLPNTVAAEPRADAPESKETIGLTARDAEGLPNADRVDMLFNRGEPQLPIVETIAYQSKVAWLQGRPAWISDYATHFKTPRHFISRSLSGGANNYYSQDVRNGDRINVYRQDKNLSFYLLVDASRCKMWLYYLDGGPNGERVLLKRYDVGLGRPDERKASGLLTPYGQYSLGSRVATYSPKVMGYHKGDRVEMVRVFGSRWIPFESELGGCTEPARGYGIHGLPWDEQGVEETASLGGYESDGCIRLKQEDIEEIFAIIIAHPAVIEIVPDFREAKLPGKEAT